MKIRLYIVHHQDIRIPEASCLNPIRSDRTDGDNITVKESYCELRAQYWVWKNVQLTDSDYVGFFHYRRYFDFGRGKVLLCPTQKRPLPYRIVQWPQAKHYTFTHVSECIQGFEVIAPVWEYTGLSIWERYSKSTKQRKEDLELVYQIIKERYPHFISAADEYLSGKGEYYGNMFLMSWALFQSYCTWLFDILEEFDRRVDSPLPRTNGFLGERLFGIYFIWLQSQRNVRCGELPRLHFSGYDDENHHLAKEKKKNMFVRPGGKLRSLLRKIIYGRKN